MSSSRVTVGGSFHLNDHDGNFVTDETYAGRHMIIFFGFTHCRKVCPEALSKITRVLEQLGSDASAFVPLYITVDPDRDTPAVMKTFLEQSYPRFIGLTGDKSQIDEVRTAYKVFAQKSPDEDDPEGYAVPHSALIYITDKEGKYISHFNDGAPINHIVTALRSLIDC
jgi:protein SCO1